MRTRSNVLRIINIYGQWGKKLKQLFEKSFFYEQIECILLYALKKAINEFSLACLVIWSWLNVCEFGVYVFL